MAKPRLGWAKDFDRLQNDDAAPRDVDGAMTDGLGDEMDEAFRRGREYCTKGYSLSAGKQAVKKKEKEYQKEFIRGWNWQRARKPKKKKGI